jgi:hypothetical protein
MFNIQRQQFRHLTSVKSKPTQAISVFRPRSLVGNFDRIQKMIAVRGGISSSATPPPPKDDDASKAAPASTEPSAAAIHQAGMIRVAYQGEPGAYSEKSTRELLGKSVIAIGYPSFEAWYVVCVLTVHHG